MSEAGIDVLVVDDDPVIREVLRQYIGSQGFVVEVVTDGEEALQKIAALNPALVLLDLYLPGISGIEVLQRMRDEGLEAAVIAISGTGDEDKARQSLALGAADFIMKPFDFEYLETSLRAKLAVLHT